MAEIVGDSPDSEPTRRDLSEARYPEVNPAFIGRSENCWERVTVQVAEVKQSLLAEEDLDLDDRLTIEDLRRAQGIRGDGHFVIPTTDGQTVAISGLYQLANILQELAIAEEEGRTTVTLEQARIEEPVVDRTSRMIRERFWKNLTRRIDAASLLEVLQDEKIDTAENHFLFVPESDPIALRYFREVAENDPSLRLEVIPFPRHASAGFMQKLHGKHGLVSLALEEGEGGTFHGVPFVVPGGRFNEMYGWDSYFISLGLLEDGKADLAKSMKDNFIYQLTHYGKILNANRSYYFNRSQPPFTSSLILEVYEALPRSPENLAWLQRGLEAAMNEYHEVWMAAPRLGPTGLSHYGGESVGEPIETEEGHFDWLYDELAAERGISVDELREQYAKGTLVVPELDNFFRHDCAVRESGHDTTSRWRVDGVDRCADFAPVDLNSLLYKTEMDFATALEEHFGGSFVRSDGKVEAASDWLERAAKRKTIMMELLWDEAEGCFFDFDTKAQVRHPYMSATALYPLWASRPDDMLGGILSEKQASRLVARVLPELEVAGGLCSTSEASVRKAGVAPGDRQWDFPQGWAPHQLIAWKGLAQYGMNSDAERLAYRWMYTIASNIVKYNGTVPEKYDVVNRTHAVMSEYGNVGTDFRYITREGFGWMNASFQIGKRYIGEKKALLNRLVEPELLS